MAREHLLPAEAYKERDIGWRDPGELLEDNPPAQIVNWASYRNLEENFDPNRFDPVQITGVRVGEEIRELILDGCTRTAYAHKHDRLVPVVNINSNGRGPLSMSKYLREVVLTTKGHRDIAEDRIAAHLINGWNSMVGEDMAWRYSAVAALSYLGRNYVHEHDSEGLEIYFKANGKVFFPTETQEERERIIGAIVETSRVLEEADLRARKVAESAFGLLIENSIVPGEENKARRELFGLLYSEYIETKLRTFEEGTREQQRVGLGDTFFAALRRVASSEDASESFETLEEAFNDRELTYQETIDVLNSLSPKETYDHIRRNKNREAVTEAYRERMGRGLTENERMLIQKVAYIPDYPGAGVESGFLDEIQRSQKLIWAVDEYLVYLRGNKEELIDTGVQAETIDETLKTLESGRHELLSSESFVGLMGGRLELNKFFKEQRRNIQNTVEKFQLEELITQVFGEDVNDRLKKDLGLYILTRESVSEPDGELDMQKVKKLIRTMNDLDDDLRKDVFTGRKRLAFAISLQKTREEVMVDEETTQEEKEDFEKPEEVAVKVAPSEEDAQEERINYSNAIYSQAFSRSLEILETTDIERDEVRPEIVAKAIALINRLGRLIYDIPDAHRVLKEYKESLPEKKRKILEEVQTRSKRGY